MTRDLVDGFNEEGWAPQQQVPGVATSVGPSLALYQGKLFMAWKGVLDYDQGIWWSTFDGAAWSPQESIPGVGTNHRPDLAILGNTLYAAWKGADGDQKIWWSTFDGSAWAPQTLLAGAESNVGLSLIVGPSSVALGEQLLAVWKGPSGDDRVWSSTLSNGDWSVPEVVPGIGTSAEPSDWGRVACESKWSYVRC